MKDAHVVSDSSMNRNVDPVGSISVGHTWRD